MNIREKFGGVRRVKNISVADFIRDRLNDADNDARRNEVVADILAEVILLVSEDEHQAFGIINDGRWRLDPNA